MRDPRFAPDPPASSRYSAQMTNETCYDVPLPLDWSVHPVLELDSDMIGDQERHKQDDGRMRGKGGKGGGRRRPKCHPKEGNEPPQLIRTEGPTPRRY